MLVDWLTWFLPAIARFGAGGSPYVDAGIFNPIWTFWLLIPVQSLTEPAKTLAGFCLPYAALVYVSWKLKKPSLIAIVGLSHPFLQLAWYGNIDWLVLFGLVAVNQWSPFFLLIKPQAAALVMLAWLKKHNWKIFIPVSVALVFNVLAYPDWLGNIIGVTGRLETVRNFSLFPYSLIIGLPLAYMAYKQENALYGAVASLLCSPYFFMHSLVPALVLLTLKHQRAAIAVNLFFWIVFIGLGLRG